MFFRCFKIRNRRELSAFKVTVMFCFIFSPDGKCTAEKESLFLPVITAGRESLFLSVITGVCTPVRFLFHTLPASNLREILL